MSGSESSQSASSRIVPSRTDPVAVSGSAIIGGPFGRFARWGGSWWTPVRVLILMASAAYALGFLLDYPCMSNGWVGPDRYEHLCYSDIPPLYSLRGFADGYLPYLQTPPDGQPLEYPVLIGIFMQVMAWITRGLNAVIPDLNTGLAFFTITVVALLPFLIMAVIATARTVRARPWDAAMVALAPSVILAATINWDLLAIGLAAVSIALWAREKPTWAGVFLGLAIAAKFYPVLFLGPLLLLCLRSGHMRAFARLLAATIITWLVLNVPFAIANTEGWSYFYTYSSERGADFGSLWYAVSLWGGPNIPVDSLNVIALGSLLVLCAGIGLLILFAPRRPRLAPMLFLVVAAFLLTNKVYSPQFVLWLIPLAALARPKWRDFLIWQAAEVAYFVAVWWFLAGYGVEDAKGMTPEWYAFFVFVHIGATIWFSALIVRDALYPEFDIVRNDGVRADRDDPGGGVLDGAPDHLPWSKIPG